MRTSFSFALWGGCPTAFTSGAEDRKDHPKLWEGYRAGQIQASRSRCRRKLSGHLTGARRTRAEAGHRLSFRIFFGYEAAAVVILKHFWSHCNVQRIFQLANLPPLLHLPGQQEFLRFASSVRACTANPRAASSHTLPSLQSLNPAFHTWIVMAWFCWEEQHTCQTCPARPALHQLLLLMPRQSWIFTVPAVSCPAGLVRLTSVHKSGQGLVPCAHLSQQHLDPSTDSWLFKALIRRQITSTLSSHFTVKIQHELPRSLFGWGSPSKTKLKKVPPTYMIFPAHVCSDLNSH